MKDVIKVLIVDDSPVARELLAFIIHSDPLLRVIGCAESGEKALQMLKHIQPDVITMDIVMPIMNGFETTRKIIETQPIPIIMISGLYEPEKKEHSFKAFEAGAIAILEKPTGLNHPRFPELSKNIVSTIKAMSEVKLITRHNRATIRNTDKSTHKPVLLPEKPPKNTIQAVAIGASLGGPQTLQTILAELPADFPVPIFVVQHISPGFIHGLVDWLQDSSKLKICLAKDQENAQPGTVYIAPDHYHLEIKKDNTISLINDPIDNGIKPSVSRLFRSMTKAYGPNSIGILLTGMGRDGVDGLLEMKENGAYTIAQDKEGCIMFGMPAEAIQIGAAQAILHFSDIAIALCKLTGSIPH